LLLPLCRFCCNRVIPPIAFRIQDDNQKFSTIAWANDTQATAICRFDKHLSRIAKAHFFDFLSSDAMRFPDMRPVYMVPLKGLDVNLCHDIIVNH